MPSIFKGKPRHWLAHRRCKLWLRTGNLLKVVHGQALVSTLSLISFAVQKLNPSCNPDDSERVQKIEHSKLLMSSNDTSPRDGVELASGDVLTVRVDDGNVTRLFILFSVVEVEAGDSGQRWLKGRRHIFKGEDIFTFRTWPMNDPNGRRYLKKLPYHINTSMIY